jgi:pentatricopeptide repeat protein
MKALELLQEIKTETNYVTFTIILKGCLDMEDYQTGIQIHKQMQLQKIEPDDKLKTVLLSLYSKVGNLEQALSLFHSISATETGNNTILWNSIIHAFCSNINRTKTL